jgi:hypothetical protein
MCVAYSVELLSNSVYTRLIENPAALFVWKRRRRRRSESRKRRQQLPPPQPPPSLSRKTMDGSSQQLLLLKRVRRRRRVSLRRSHRFHHQNPRHPQSRNQSRSLYPNPNRRRTIMKVEIGGSARYGAEVRKRRRVRTTSNRHLSQKLRSRSPWRLNLLYRNRMQSRNPKQRTKTNGE